jgi:hypothetical protein
MRHACEMHAHEVYSHEMHSREVHAHEMHAYEMHAYEMHAYEMHARRHPPIRCTSIVVRPFLEGGVAVGVLPRYAPEPIPPPSPSMANFQLLT